ncbi:hypothetical protein E1091_00250 [Micromonospora fluostatini]|uniref:Uncharacterized protein n=1 Tax=Micromonospora fluostatini TaxID=1629071 RepID=A0ABY2DMA0_9ACTN|nr:hypothetical protein E1091_00250 [Micromonospora fluostatini]
MTEPGELFDVETWVFERGTVIEKITYSNLTREQADRLRWLVGQSEGMLCDWRPARRPPTNREG